MKSFKPPRKWHHSGVYNKEQYIKKRTGMRCQICNEEYSTELLDFHHPLDSNKLMGLDVNSWRGVKGPKKETLDEADKCVILCSNCHRLEHVALKRGETLTNDKKAYSRYRNHRVTRYENLDDWYSERIGRGQKFSTSV